MIQNQQTLRPLTLKQGVTEISILVSENVWGYTQQLKEEFPTAENAENVNEIELAARFMKFASDRAIRDSIFIEVAKVLFIDFTSKYLKSNNIHAATRNLVLESKKSVIKAYYSTLNVLEKTNTLPDENMAPVKSALFEAAASGDAKLFAVFGGQGNIEEYFDELADIWEIYKEIVRPFVLRMADVLNEYARNPDVKVLYSEGLDILRWLEDSELRPDVQYLISAPVSLPLIGLIQLLHYYIMIRVLNRTPFEIRDLFKGTTGHSQGIISSVVISASSTENEFLSNSEKALGLLFWIGARAQQEYPSFTLNPAVIEDSINNNEGNPTPMLAITGLRESQILNYVKETNSHLAPERQIVLALRNGPRSFVCTGPPQSLYGLNLALRKLKAPTGLDQSRIPYSQRKIKFSFRFLPITARFHSFYLNSVVDKVMEDAKNNNLLFDSSSLKIPVLSTDSGKNLQNANDLTKTLLELICICHVDWEKSTAVEGLTHVIDFGPGGTSGIGSLTYRNKEGTGVEIVLAGVLEGSNDDLSYKADLFDLNVNSVKYSQNWAKLFQPKLVKTASGRIHIDTKMSRLLGKPPLMVAGMTPATVNEKFVAAVMNAGYHVELAGGGHFNEDMLRDKVHKIMELTRAGEGITLNIIFLNVLQWGFQYPLIQVMRKEGLPMEGLCIAAGVPSLDNANEIIANLQAAGIRHVAFKPGNADTIRQVVAIAAANPTMPVILQWTGGRAGGHHGFEDVHQPILETYAAIRRQPNIVLVAGSGFGGAEDTLPYITGDWSVKFDYPPMPFDGVLFGSRMMVAKEGLASPAAKQAMVDAPGVDDSEWEKTYKVPAGGVLTVLSELGEPIHKIATRGVRLWKELDESIFSLPKDKRLPALLAKKDYIIKRLNADFQKVWFGKKKTGEAVDLQDMTYSEVVYRMIELLYIKFEARWIDISLRNFVGDFLRRVEERFSKSSTSSMLQNYAQLENPFPFVEEFLAQFPDAETQLLTSEDVLHFISLCKRPNQKPVPFIPIMDKDFDIWFKKDSLWQSEDLAAVVDQDVQRTCILHGPVAAKYATRIDQPVAEILNDIYNSHINSLKERYYKDTIIPEIEYLGGVSITKTSVQEIFASSTEQIFETSSNPLPDTDEWIQAISGPNYNWLRALLTSPFIVQGKRFADNTIKDVFRPRVNQKVIVSKNALGHIVSVKVQDRRQWSVNGNSTDYTTSIELTESNNSVTMTLYEKKGDDFIPLVLRFEYKPELGYAPIHEIMTDRNERIKNFYFKLWFGVDNNEDFLNYPLDGTIVNKGEVVKFEDISEFCHAVGNKAEIFGDRNQKVVSAPMDFAIVVGWKAIMKGVFPKIADGDLIRLVHAGISFRMLAGEELLKVGDVVDTFAKINAVTNISSGKMIEVKSLIVRDGKPVLEVTSWSLYRGNFVDFENTFEHKTEIPMEYKIYGNKEIAILKSKEWIHWNDISEQYKVAPGKSLIFRLETELKYKNSKVYSSVKTTGSVTMQVSTKEFIEVAKVNYESGESHGNPVTEFLKRHAHEIEQAHFFENGGYSIMPIQSTFPSIVHAPTSNEPYANISGDFNPIHVNPYFADLARLPGTITHGMWTSASTRKFVEIFAADNVPRRVVAYDVKFVGMVLPSDRLETKLYHIGMKNGRKIIKVETYNQNNERVVEGTAEVEQPITAYVFTGQGSQEKGMGMDLYNSSPVAKAIWDKADKHFLENYGFSILDIVRNNPKEKTIHFGGPKGEKIRQNYMSMLYDVVDPDGSIHTLRLFPTIDEYSPSYTFVSPNGLLSATQFTQPALTLMEKAAFEDMRSKELIQANCAFAGHSLGEYSALAAVGDILPLSSLVDVVFYRGMAMQSAVKRDELGRSNYSMVAVNPARVSKTFDDAALRFVVDSIARRGGDILEIVNFNVENWQYVAAGALQNLDALANVLNYINMSNIDFQKLIGTESLDSVREKLNTIIDDAFEKTKSKQAKGFINLERGRATIPLSGIDVPFHSSFLLSGVTPFRTFLAKKFNPSDIDVNQLKNRYIPNLVAQPFSTEKSYIENIYRTTSSPRLAKVLQNWTDDKYSTPAQQQRLGYIILIELLAYQFASPVRWIETQDELFKNYKIERLIEVGPSPTLTGMAVRTLGLKYQSYDTALNNRRQTLCISKDSKEIYYELESSVEEVVEPAALPKVNVAPAPIAIPAPAPVAAPTTGPAAAVADVPVSAIEIILAVVAQKLKKSINDVPLSKSIKDLVSGKSTLQNEILGDLQKEFNNNMPEKAEESSLQDIGSALNGVFSGTLGQHSNTMIAKLISAKMPGGFTLNSAKNYLNSAYGLGPGRADGVLLVGITMEPASRLGAEAEAKAWLDSVAKAYASKTGISLTAASASPAPAPTPAVAVASATAAPSLPTAISDVPISATEVILAVVAQKLKKSVNEVPLSKSIKDLVGGKSTLQNEILGDLQKEFNNGMPEKAEESSLEELGSSLGSSFSGALGKHTSSLIAKLVGAKLPGGFTLNSAKNYLNSTFGLGPGRTDGSLLIGITMEPATRLSTEVEAKSWLDNVAAAYASKTGISLSSNGGASALGNSMSSGVVATMINNAEFDALKAKQDALIYQQLNLYAKYLQKDLREGARKYEEEKVVTKKLQAELDLWLNEHGDVYAEGIKPLFSPLKARRYDSYWNWARQDALEMWYDLIFGKSSIIDREITAKCLNIMNRAHPKLIEYMRYKVENCTGDEGETYKIAKEFGQALIENCVEVLAEKPYFKCFAIPTSPHTSVTEKGDIKYSEVPRPGCDKLANYVDDMIAGSEVSEYSNRLKVQRDLGHIYEIILRQNNATKSDKLAMEELYSDILRALSMSNTIVREQRPRSHMSDCKHDSSNKVKDTIPFLHLKRQDHDNPINGWEFSNKLTKIYLDALIEISKKGITFAGKYVLLTGAGRDSIGSEVMKGLLAGGAKVIVTTSRFSRQVTEYFQSIYKTYGAKDSELILVPFNQGAKQDVDALVNYIYSREGLNWDLDFIIPFAAIPENGRELDSIDSKSELAHRIMLTNLLRILGNVKTHKQKIGSDTRPAQVILPLSPNHGTFGGDGLYGESKISLETLFNRWYSESWSSYLSITGAIIGWTRGTGLMSASNIVAEGVEALGVRTFSTVEMAFNLLGLMHPTIVKLCQREPVYADLNGGLQFIPKLKELTTKLRSEIYETAEIRKAIAAENALDYKVVFGEEAERKNNPYKVTPRANMKFEFPKLKPYEALKHLSYLKGMLDLDKVIVIAGMGEVSPWGNARTRWEMEAYGAFSLEGCIEMAWIMGYIKHFDGRLKNGNIYSGWVDAETEQPVEDKDIKAKYEKQILEHTGVRLIEPAIMDGYNPEKKTLLQEVMIDHDLEPFECSKEEAEHFKHQQGDKADIYESGNGSWYVHIHKGATLYIPKALRFDRLVAGQIPTGWDATRYGIPKDVIDQVDPVTVYNMVSTVEAFISAGITDPYECYKYIHVSEMGNTIGSGVGGQAAQRGFFRGRFLDQPVQKDILQESQINTMAAWINMLLISSSGPIKTPVDACATAAISIEMACESLLSGKAKIMIAGASEETTEESSYEFANMKATSSAAEEFAKGRTPSEMSRPATTTRSGFMESHGSATHVLMTAATAIEIGSPIYGIIAHSSTATDKEGRSVPAPGAGILTTARENVSKRASPMLNFKYRAKQIKSRRAQIKAWVESEFEDLQEELEELKSSGEITTAEEEKTWLEERTSFIEKQAKRQEKEALATFQHQFYQNDPEIAPLRGALAVYGLTIDDIGVASFHGTSTKANDKNESRVINAQMKHLGRTKGNALLAITQKYLTGHPKGPAAAWMANGMMQAMLSGIVPGNRNADNIDADMKELDYIVFPCRSIQTDGLKAGLLKSFGFGQAGGEVLIIHPDYIFGALEEKQYNTYKAKNINRYSKAYRYLHDTVTGLHTFVQVKNEAPYSEDLEYTVYLNPSARAEYSKEKRSWYFTNKSANRAAPTSGDIEVTKSIISSLAEQQAGKRGVGVDVELTKEVNIENSTFIERNFTPAEIEYCQARPDPQASFAGRWSAKEAVFKAISSYGNIPSDGAGAPLKEIEIKSNEVGAPEVVLTGKAEKAALSAGIKNINVSISHSGAYSAAVALAQ
ncbi:fatty acid synthase [Cokeromyces recurvatus]|uniref:fatty acid synthase n=1 Tax=Cokeromyces recurvatus TaxID=90255 RepID=UPI00221E4274|nr:fatty acid synthase [Cokeromyces recurvatus]KAI7907575.1 fatty acid synthase [Cokeromyces recurvatus]